MDSTIPKIKLEHTDVRGEIYSIALPDNRELMLLFSKAGALRGGHSHDCDEVVMLLTGKMRYHKVDQAGDPSYDIMTPECAAWEHGYRVKSLSLNPAGEVHMGEFLEDSWVLEWKFAEKGKWTQTDYEPMREKVRASQR